LGKLNRNRNQQKEKLLLFSFLLVITGCAALKEFSMLEKLFTNKVPDIYKERPGRFSHLSHIEFGVDCADCHPGYLDSGPDGMPDPAYCVECHEDLGVENDLKDFLINGKAVWTNVTGLKEDIKFSHHEHEEKEVTCEECHPGINTSEWVGFKLRNSKDECLDCHEENNVISDCSSCHTQINKEWKPGSHKKMWPKKHGGVARANVIPPFSNRCSLCHNDSTCSECHLANPPENHNNYWRQRSHGMAANMDREKCVVCHTPMSCDQCHLETAPRNHRASWGTSKNRHCISCHFPLQNQNCFTCHKNLSGHLAAPVMPADTSHIASNETGCRTCHGFGLSHFNGENNCRQCHK
jgi:cytochrome c3-like protein